MVRLKKTKKESIMYEIKVSGMTCGGCVNSVTKALKNLDAKAEVIVSLEAQTIKIESEKNQDSITHTIEEAGFPVIESKTL